MRASLDGALSSALSSSSRRRPSVSLAPSRSLDSRGALPPAFSSPQSAPHSSKVSFSALHPPHHRVSQSRCTSRSSASRIEGRIQSCDKSQQSSSLLCAGKLLHLDLQAVCATCVYAVKTRKNPVPTNTQNREHAACCVVYIFLVCQELGRARDVPPKQ